MEKKFNYVYITTNLINEMQYVGSHCTNNINDNYIGSGKYFMRAVKQYGKCNFKREILEQCDNILSARKLEQIYINKYNTLSPNGYNLSPTGGCEKGFSGAISEEHKKAISIWQKGKTYEELYGEEKAKIMKAKQKIKKTNLKQSKETINKRILNRKDTQKGKTYEELYGEEKAKIIKEKQRNQKLGKPSHKKGTNYKEEFIRLYGEAEGIIRLKSMIEKQRNHKLGKKQSPEAIQKRKEKIKNNRLKNK